MTKKEKVEVILFTGKRRNFRLRNPEGHPDKYKWLTLTEGMVVPKEIIPQLKAEERKVKIEERVKELEADLKDDGKRNFSKNKKKKSPGRPKKKAKKKK